MKTISAPIQFRPAEKEDLISDSKTPRYGTAYLVMNQDGKSLSGFHIITRETDITELASWFKQGRVWVPLSCLDAEIVVDNEKAIQLNDAL